MKVIPKTNQTNPIMKNIMPRLVIVLFIAVVTALATTGCRSTAHGAGEDIENMGEKIQEKTH
jgi:predicted small secreted protein